MLIYVCTINWRTFECLWLASVISCCFSFMPPTTLYSIPSSSRWRWSYILLVDTSLTWFCLASFPFNCFACFTHSVILLTPIPPLTISCYWYWANFIIQSSSRWFRILTIFPDENIIVIFEFVRFVIQQTIASHFSCMPLTSIGICCIWLRKRCTIFEELIGWWLFPTICIKEKSIRERGTISQV